jgi:hypothetical protein
MNNKLERAWKKAGVTNFRYYLGVCLEALRKTTKTSIRVIGPGRD